MAASSESSKDDSSLELEIGWLNNDLKKQKSEAQKLKKRIKQLEETIDLVQKEHHQLQANQMPYKRIHKQVKMNKQAGTKECPECHTEIPMEANFCKKCAYGFWDIETIGSAMNGKS